MEDLDKEDIPVIRLETYSPNCRVCKWYKSNNPNIPLFNYVHDHALKGFSPGKIIELLKEEYFPKHGITEKVPTKKSFYTHFSKHLDINSQVHMRLARNDLPEINAPLLSDEDERALIELKEGKFDEYKELCDLYIRFKSVQKKIYAYTNALQAQNGGRTADGGPVWSNQKIQTYVTMINTQKAILAEIAKQRQGEKLIKLAAQRSLETFTEQVLAKLKDEFIALGSIMKTHGASDDVMENFERITGLRLAEIIISESQRAMEVTSKEFKLPN